MSKTKKNIAAAVTFFTITIALSFLSWNYEIDQAAWLDKAARPEDILHAIKNNPGNVNTKDGSGWTGLMLAVERGDLDLARLLLQNNADPNILSSDQNRGTVLHMMCRKSMMLDRNMEILKLLLEHKANPNIKDAFGRTPLHWIGMIGNENYRTRVLDLLMKYGADLNVQDNNGDTPLNTMIDYLWSRDPHWFATALFGPYGSKINPTLKNKKGQDSKDYAVARRCLPIAKFLCSTGKWKCTPAQEAGAIE